MHDLATRRVAQFIVATHSPMLLCLPGARILSFEEGRISEVRHDETEHFQLTRGFLNDPARYLRYLLDAAAERSDGEA